MKRSARIVAVLLIMAASACSPSVSGTSLVGAALHGATPTQSPVPPPACDPGDCIWLATFNGQDSRNDYASAITADPVGDRVYVTGVSYSKTGSTGVTIAYSVSDGSTIWETVDPLQASAIAAGGDRVFIGGTVENRSTVAALDAATGDLVWKVAGLSGTVSHMSLDGDRGLVVSLTGHVRGQKVVAFDTATGAVQWSRRLPISFIGGLAPSPSGGIIYLSGTKALYPNTKLALLAVGSVDGNVLWKTSYVPQGSTATYGEGLAVSAEGTRIYVTGAARPGPHFLVLAYDARSRQLRWADSVRQPGPSYLDPAFLEVQATATRVIAAGYEDSDTMGGLITAGFDPRDGTDLWTRHADRCRLPVALGLEVDGYAAVVTATCDEAIATVAYRVSDGTRSWIRELRGGTQSISVGSTILTDGTIVTTGWIMLGPPDREDMVTIASPP